MRISFMAAAAIAALSISSATLAQPAPDAAAAPKVKSGEMLYSTDGAALGRIDYVQKSKDGAPEYVGLIRETRVVHVPADTLSNGPKGPVTSLSRKEVDRLN